MDTFKEHFLAFQVKIFTCQTVFSKHKLKLDGFVRVRPWCNKHYTPGKKKVQEVEDVARKKKEEEEEAADQRSSSLALKVPSSFRTLSAHFS